MEICIGSVRLCSQSMYCRGTQIVCRSFVSLIRWRAEWQAVPPLFIAIPFVPACLPDWRIAGGSDGRS